MNETKNSPTIEGLDMVVVCFVSLYHRYCIAEWIGVFLSASSPLQQFSNAFKYLFSQ